MQVIFAFLGLHAVNVLLACTGTKGEMTRVEKRRERGEAVQNTKESNSTMVFSHELLINFVTLKNSR